MIMITEVFRTKKKTKKLMDFFKTEEETKTITFNVLDSEMTDFEFPTFEDNLLEMIDYSSNKVYLNKLYFIDFDMDKLLPEQKSEVENYLNLLEENEYWVKEINKDGLKLLEAENKFKELNDGDKKKEINEIKNKVNILNNELKELVDNDGSISEETVPVHIEVNKAEIDRNKILFFKPRIKAAFAAVYDLKIMEDLEKNYSFYTTSEINRFCIRKSETKLIIEKPQYEELERKKEELEVRYEEMYQILMQNNQETYEARYKYYDEPLKIFKKEQGKDLFKKSKIINDLLGEINIDYASHREVERSRESGKTKIITTKINNTSKIQGVKVRLEELKVDYYKLVGKGIPLLKSMIQTYLKSYNSNLVSLSKININEIPYIVNKDKLNLFLINLSELNMFEHSKLGFGYDDKTKTIFGVTPSREGGMIKQKFNINTEIERMRKTILSIVDKLPEAVSETQEITRAMIEETIVNSYQTDLSNKSKIDLFIDPEFLFKVSFEWTSQEPELVLDIADPFFAIPNIIGNFNDFKKLYNEDINKINIKIFPINKMKVKKYLEEDELKKVFKIYSDFVTENYSKLVEAKFSSILHMMGTINHSIIQNPVNKSFFVSPLGKGKFEYLYEHIPFGTLTPGDLFDDNISDKYYNNILSSISGQVIHWEADMNNSIRKVMTIFKNNLGGSHFNKILLENIDIFFKGDNSLLPYLDKNNESLKKKLVEGIVKEPKPRYNINNLKTLTPEGK